MKVIKPGNKNRIWKKRATCTGRGTGGQGCGALLEINTSDIFSVSIRDYSGDSDCTVRFVCPLCATETVIPMSWLPVDFSPPSRVVWQIAHPRNPVEQAPKLKEDTSHVGY